MIIYVDIDETICYYKDERDYRIAIPYQDRIKKLNELYDSGKEIHYWTSRGYVSGRDWLQFTKNQLDSWGCKYHSVKTKKPKYDLFIDDKNINSEDYFK